MERNSEKKFLNYSSCNLKSASGITLIALVVTIIVLLILAGVSLSAVFSDKGIFSRAEESGAKYNEAKAREVLETVLLADGQYEKNINPEYNQDDFLDELIINEIPGTEIKGDVAIVGGWGFELDRSVPKIGRGLGKADKLVFPTVEIISGPTLIDNGRKATFEAKVTETTKGVSRIELWLDGKKIDKETKTYETLQKEITVTFEVNKNGKYIVKAYADLMGKATTTVEGIIPAVIFSPNGDKTYKKEHQVKVTAQETTERVKSIKYQWLNTTVEPEESTFTTACNNGDVITGKGYTGTYYLWTLLETENGKININRSEGFNFDNESPEVTLTSTPVSETSFTLNAIIADKDSGIEKCDFYVDGVLKPLSDLSEEIATCTVEKMPTGEVECYVLVKDKAGNQTTQTVTGKTKLYTWSVYKAVAVGNVSWEKTGTFSKVKYTSNTVKAWHGGMSVAKSTVGLTEDGKISPTIGRESQSVSKFVRWAITDHRKGNFAFAGNDVDNGARGNID